MLNARELHRMMNATANIPLCLVAGNYVYGLITPLKIPPSFNIPIIMEKYNCKVFWKKLKLIKLGQACELTTFRTLCRKIYYLLYNFINIIFLLNTNWHSQQVAIAIINLNQNNHPNQTSVIISTTITMKELLFIQPV